MLFDCMISRNLKTLIAAAVFAGIAIGCSSPGNKAQNFAFEIAKKFESKSAAKIAADFSCLGLKIRISYFCYIFEPVCCIIPGKNVIFF